jgi:hypothetical protein
MSKPVAKVTIDPTRNVVVVWKRDRKGWSVTDTGLDIPSTEKMLREQGFSVQVLWGRAGHEQMVATSENVARRIGVAEKREARRLNAADWRAIYDALLEAAERHHSGPRADHFITLARKIREEKMP